MHHYFLNNFDNSTCLVLSVVFGRNLSLLHKQVCCFANKQGNTTFEKNTAVIAERCCPNSTNKVGADPQLLSDERVLKLQCTSR